MTHTWGAGDLGPRQGRVISIPTNVGDLFAYGMAERRFIRSRSWWGRQYANTLRRLGFDLYFKGGRPNYDDEYHWLDPVASV